MNDSIRSIYNRKSQNREKGFKFNSANDYNARKLA